MDFKKQTQQDFLLDLIQSVHAAKESQPYLIEYHEVEAKTYFERYEALQEEGFTPSEALEIIKARGIT